MAGCKSKQYETIDQEDGKSNSGSVMNQVWSQTIQKALKEILCPRLFFLWWHRSIILTQE